MLIPYSLQSVGTLVIACLLAFLVKNMPWHVLPTPVNPGLHVHPCEPITLRKLPSQEQSSLAKAHSSKSIEDPRKRKKYEIPYNLINPFSSESPSPSVFKSPGQVLQNYI